MSYDKHIIDIDLDNHNDNNNNPTFIRSSSSDNENEDEIICRRRSIIHQSSANSKLSTDRKHSSNKSKTFEIDPSDPTFEHANSKSILRRNSSDVSNSVKSSNKSISWIHESKPENIDNNNNDKDNDNVNNDNNGNKSSNKSTRKVVKKLGLFRNMKKNLFDRIYNINNYIDDWRQGLFKIKLVQEDPPAYNIGDLVYCNKYYGMINRVWKIASIMDHGDNTDYYCNLQPTDNESTDPPSTRVKISEIGKDYYYELDFRQINRVASATMYIFFTQAIPAITFASLASERTDNSIGITEALFSMGIGGSLFAIAAGQPLVIVGITGPVCIFVISLYNYSSDLNLNFIGLLFWTCFWSCIFCIISAAMNLSELFELKVTNFSCDSFGFLIGVIYMYEGIIILVSIFEEYKIDAALLSLLLGLGCLHVGNLSFSARGWNINRHLRNFIADYGAVIVIIAFTGFQFLPKFKTVSIPKLNIPKIFKPSLDRPWIDYDAWASISTKGLLLSIGMGLVLSILLYFDHNVSAALTQSVKFKLSKPTSYDYDFFLLGISVFICGILGIIPNYGLLPQAPLHVRSLATISMEEQGVFSAENVQDVIETRWSALLQSVLMFVLLAKPLLYLISLIPLGVIAGVFIFLGLEGLRANALTERLQYILMDEDARHIGEKNRYLQKLQVNIEKYESIKKNIINRGESGAKVSLFTNKLKYYKNLPQQLDCDRLKVIIDEMDDELDEILVENIDDKDSENGNRPDAGSIPADNDFMNEFSSIEAFENMILNDFRLKYSGHLSGDSNGMSNIVVNNIDSESCDSTYTRQSEDNATVGSDFLDFDDDFEKYIIKKDMLYIVFNDIIMEFEGIKSRRSIADDISSMLRDLHSKINFYQSLRTRSILCTAKNFRDDDKIHIFQYFKKAIKHLVEKQSTSKDIKRHQKTFEKRVDRIIDTPEKIHWQRLDFFLLRRYSLIQLAIALGIFGIALSKAAFIFPVFILLLVPFRLYVLPLLLIKGNLWDHTNIFDNFNWKDGVQNEFLNDVDSNLVPSKE